MTYKISCVQIALLSEPLEKMYFKLVVVLSASEDAFRRQLEMILGAILDFVTRGFPLQGV